MMLTIIIIMYYYYYALMLYTYTITLICKLLIQISVDNTILSESSLWHGVRLIHSTTTKTFESNVVYSPGSHSYTH
jgi:hypothetical protein